MDRETVNAATGERLCQMLWNSIDALDDNRLRRLLCHLFDLLDEQACEEVEA